jgi:FkbM family methyltransferase
MASLKRWLDVRRNPWKRVFHDAFKAWRRDGGQRRLETYDLPEGAVVFDLGGYVGAWTEDVLRCQPTAIVHVFEPHPDFAAKLEEKFKEHSNVHIHAFALGQTDGTLTLSDAGDASSAVAQHDTAFEAEIRSVDRFFEEIEIGDIALAKVNIEGGEYDVIPAWITHGAMA